MKSFHFDHVRLKSHEQIGLHSQPTWELDYIIRGHGRRTLGGTTEPFSEGEIVLLRPKVPHVWQFEPTEGDIENISLTFSDGFLHAAAGALPELQLLVSSLIRLPAAIILSGNTRARIGRMLVGMERQDEAGALLTLLEILHLISQSSDRKTVGSVSTESVTEKRLKDIDIYIRCNYAHGITLSDIATHIGMNTSSLCAFFKQHTGQTLIGRLTEVRMEWAKYMLTHTTESISTICYSVGYNDLPHFCRIFRREVGVSPKEFRNTSRL